MTTVTKENQVFIFWTAEPPSQIFWSREKYTSLDNFFNWTYTYRHDADVQGLYGFRKQMIDAVPKGTKAVDSLLKKKTESVMAVVSHCQGDIGRDVGLNFRLKYIRDLEDAGLPLTKLGKCFSSRVSNEVLEENFQKHKFYLAFENSLHCTDYITEKLWNKSLLKGLVPIVMGPKKEDYIAALPLNSFIHVEDFESPDHLVGYINYLDRNPDVYRKYFRWREDKGMTDEAMMKLIQLQHPHVRVHPPPKSICQRVLEHKRSKNSPRKTIRSLYNEFVAKNPTECIGETIQTIHDFSTFT